MADSIRIPGLALVVGLSVMLGGCARNDDRCDENDGSAQPHCAAGETGDETTAGTDASGVTLTTATTQTTFDDGPGTSTTTTTTTTTSNDDAGDTSSSGETTKADSTGSSTEGGGTQSTDSGSEDTGGSGSESSGTEGCAGFGASCDEHTDCCSGVCGITTLCL